ncbi:hypothetical protein LEMLEM_LOCUS1336 [Lemmus lemmus]
MSRSIKCCLCVKGLRFRKRAERDLWKEQQQSSGMHQEKEMQRKNTTKGVVKEILRKRQTFLSLIELIRIYCGIRISVNNIL